MEDWKATVSFLEEIARAMDPGLDIAERASLYAGGKVAIQELYEHVEKYCFNDGYAREKLHKAGWSLAAGLGVDYGNGHEAQQHRVWMLGSLSSLSNKISEFETQT